MGDWQRASPRLTPSPFRSPQLGSTRERDAYWTGRSLLGTTRNNSARYHSILPVEESISLDAIPDLQRSAVPNAGLQPIRQPAAAPSNATSNLGWLNSTNYNAQEFRAPVPIPYQRHHMLASYNERVASPTKVSTAQEVPVYLPTRSLLFPERVRLMTRPASIFRNNRAYTTPDPADNSLLAFKRLSTSSQALSSSPTSTSLKTRVRELSRRVFTTLPESQVATRAIAAIPSTSPSTQVTSSLPTPNKLFRPMEAIADPWARMGVPTLSPPSRNSDDGSRSVDNHNFSSRYGGKHCPANASMDHLAEEQNCSLWLTNLPPNVTYPELLGLIRGMGRVYCTYINRPDYRQHRTAAAKVVFFAPEAATRFLLHVQTQQPSLGGYRLRVDRNRIKSAASREAGTRVLLVTGRADFVNVASLDAYFSHNFVFEVDRAVELIQRHGRAVVEFRFGSYRCQAQCGRMALERERPDGFEMVEYADDPCEVGETGTAYITALRRIEGIGLA